MPDHRDISLTVSPSDAGLRLDIFLGQHLPDCSRSSAARLLKSGAIRVDGKRAKPAYRLDGSEAVTGRLPEAVQLVAAPEAIALDVLHEDRAIIVINKPPGLVVHPAPGHPGGTLVNALLFHCGDLSGTDGDIRPGIVHRLDRDTSGVLVVAKNDVSQRHLAAQFKARRTRKWYRAIVVGRPPRDHGRCEGAIGRHPLDRKKMSIHSRQGRDALTLWQVRTRWQQFAELELEIKTGRTHQIRVHCAAMGFPVLGDAVYGSSLEVIHRHRRWPGPVHIDHFVGRQLLHAWRLTFRHPVSGQKVAFTAPLPDDYRRVQQHLCASLQTP